MEKKQLIKSVLFTEETINKITRLSKKEDRSFSYMVRKAIKKY